MKKGFSQTRETTKKFEQVEYFVRKYI